MSELFTIIGKVTGDESDGLQNYLSTDAGDKDDNDISLGSLPGIFTSRLASFFSDTGLVHEAPIDAAQSNYTPTATSDPGDTRDDLDAGMILAGGSYEISGGFSFTADGSSDTLQDLITAINNEFSDVSAALLDGDLVLTSNTGEPFTLSGFEDISDGFTDSAPYEAPTTTTMIAVEGQDLSLLRFASDAEGGDMPVYDPTLLGFSVTDGVDTGLVTTSMEKVYMFVLPDEGDTDTVSPNIVVGVTATGEMVFAIYLDQQVDTDGDITAQLWTVQYQTFQNPGDGPDDPVSLDNVLFLSAVDELTLDAANAPSGNTLFIAFSDGNGDPDGVIVTGRNPANESEGESITSGDTVNTSQGGGPTTFGSNNQMLVASDEPGEGGALLFTFVSGLQADYTVPMLDSGEAGDESNMLFENGLNADDVTFTVSQLQGGRKDKIAVVEITAYYSERLDADSGTGINSFDGDAYIDSQMLDLYGGAGEDAAGIVEVDSVTISGQRGKGNTYFDVEVNVTRAYAEAEGTDEGDYWTVTVPLQSGGEDTSYFVTVDFYDDGQVVISGVQAGDDIRYQTDGDHNRVLI